jgi:acetyl-CoA C-acetyltransferase
MPTLIGVGRITDREAGADADPLEYLESAIGIALKDAGIPDAIRSIDSVAIAQILSRAYNDEPRALLARLDCATAELLYTPTGATAPQSLLARACDRIANGKSALAVVCGAEAFRRCPAIDWVEKTFQPYSTSRLALHGDTRPHACKTEVAYGIHEPLIAYSLLANAFASSMGWTPSEYVRESARMCEAMSSVAESNPHAWSRKAYTATEIAVPLAGNRQITAPFTKYMTARIDVNQAAAVVVASEDVADRLGVAEEKRIFLTGSSELGDTWLMSRRSSLHDSPIAGRSLCDAVASAGLRLQDVAFWDLYSCFPVAAQITMRSAMLSLECPTIIGGLPYYGGPGNHYSLHATCEAVERLRRSPPASAAVQSLCWNMHKSAVNVYANRRPLDVPSLRPPATPHTLAPPRGFAEQARGRYVVESYTVLFDRDGGPLHGLFSALDGDGARTLALAEDDAIVQEALAASPVGRVATVAYDVHRGLNRVGVLQ